MSLAFSYSTKIPGFDPLSYVVNRDWPGAYERKFHRKVPSRLAYVEENPDLDSRAWGLLVKPSMTAVSWSKLLLDPENDPEIHAEMNRLCSEGIMRIPNNKDSVVVVSDYLAEIYRAVCSKLEGQNSRSVDFWLAVPAAWSEQARARLRDAATHAGFGGRPGDALHLVTEPEAAMSYFLHLESSIGSSLSAKQGECVIICDYGGGTVDVAAYLIENENPVTYRELTVSGGEFYCQIILICSMSGNTCGSTAVDRLFYKFMEETFGDAFIGLEPRLKGPGSFLMESFEKVKKRVHTLQPDEKVIISLSSGTGQGVRNSGLEELKISGDQLMSFMKPVVINICEIILSQIEAIYKKNLPRNGYITAGFLSPNTSIHRYVDLWHTSVTYLQTDVAIGAALLGAKVAHRPKNGVCRQHYGFKTHRLYDPLTDSRSEAYRDHFNGLELVANEVSWDFEKGQECEKDLHKERKIVFTHDGKDVAYMTIPILGSRADIAPVLHNSEGVHLVALIPCDFSHFDISRFQHYKKERDVIYKIELLIKMTFEEDEGRLRFRAFAFEHPVGEVAIRV
ncbi:hypothetical protein BDV25DRAFT_141187 [Aspergillus avenaceus]|uniref:Actin-like ATPase domain-containing protein n=1 Tax=Aspergillus avenaceus TaxID=36643 RepID=A0A5N6TSG6_ASPAV|nr:hypothetical protein BDV25DRAFT_141187 [Aspergillus avenaceus]